MFVAGDLAYVRTESGTVQLGYRDKVPDDALVEHVEHLRGAGVLVDVDPGPLDADPGPLDADPGTLEVDRAAPAGPTDEPGDPDAAPRGRGARKPGPGGG